MAVTIAAFTGTETVTTTEHSMTTDTAGPDVETSQGAFQAILDVSALANGDAFEFRIYEKAISGGTQRCLFYQVFSDAQGTDHANWPSPIILMGHGWDMTLKKLAGTDRSISWSINKAA
jgi:hypothetical protein